METVVEIIPNFAASIGYVKLTIETIEELETKSSNRESSSAMEYALDLDFQLPETLFVEALEAHLNDTLSTNCSFVDHFINRRVRQNLKVVEGLKGYRYSQDSLHNRTAFLNAIRKLSLKPKEISNVMLLILKNHERLPKENVVTEQTLTNFEAIANFIFRQ